MSCETLALGQVAVSFLHSLSLKLWLAPGLGVLLFLSGTVNDPIWSNVKCTQIPQ